MNPLIRGRLVASTQSLLYAVLIATPALAQIPVNPALPGTPAEYAALQAAQACIQALPPGLQPPAVPAGTHIGFGSPTTVPGLDAETEGLTSIVGGACEIVLNSEAGLTDTWQGLPVTLNKWKLVVVVSHEMSHCDPEQTPDPEPPPADAPPDAVVQYNSQKNVIDCDHLAIYGYDLLRACYLFDKIPRAEKKAFVCWNVNANLAAYQKLSDQIREQARAQQNAQAEIDGVDPNSLPPPPWPCTNATQDPPCDNDLPCLDC